MEEHFTLKLLQTEIIVKDLSFRGASKHVIKARILAPRIKE